MGKHSLSYKVGDNVVVIKGPAQGRKGKVAEVKGLVVKRYVVVYVDGGESSPLPIDFLSHDKRGW